MLKITKKGLQFKIDITNLERYQKAMQSFVKEDGLRFVAEKVQQEAMRQIRAKFMETRGQGKDYRKTRGELTRALFSSINRAEEAMGMGTEKVSNTSYKITLVHKDLFRQFPYLQWQESGAKVNYDWQPYLVVRGRLYPIKKVLSKVIRSSQLQRGEGGKFVRGRKPNITITYRKVKHYVKARHFILEGNRWLKREGAKYAKEIIREEINRRANA